MTLDEFRALPSNVAAIWINTGDPRRRVDKKKTQQVTTPLCTDQYSFDSLPHDIAAGEVVCITGTEGSYNPLEREPKKASVRHGGINKQSLTVAGQVPDHIWYRFYKGRLWAIQIGKFFPIGYADLLQAFTAKLGDPDVTKDESFENGFGAHWTGKVLAWKQGSQAIVLTEGGGLGPGQNGLEKSNDPEVLYSDLALADDVAHHAQTPKPDF